MFLILGTEKAHLCFLSVKELMDQGQLTPSGLVQWQPGLLQLGPPDSRAPRSPSAWNLRRGP